MKIQLIKGIWRILCNCASVCEFTTESPALKGGWRKILSFSAIIEKRAIDGGYLTTPTAPQMRDVIPNRWEELMNCPKGTFKGMEEVRGDKVIFFPFFLAYVPRGVEDYNKGRDA